MSVVTTWDITAKTDVLSILEARGALKKIAAYETVVYNWTDDESGRRPVSVPVTRYRCELDLSVLSPEMYKEHYECIRKRGVQVPGPINLDYACKRYLKSPECPANLKGIGGIRWNSKERGRCLKKGEMTPFTEEEEALILKEGAKELERWKPYKDGWYRRDHTEAELDRFRKYQADFDADGRRILWMRNYASHFDSIVPDYIAAFLSDITLHLCETIEGDLLYDGDSVNGEFPPMEQPDEPAV